MISHPSILEPDTEALGIFTRQTRACLEKPFIPLKTRLNLLNTIEEILKENDQAICKAIQTDFGNRSFHETRILEISPCLMGLRYTRKRPVRWPGSFIRTLPLPTIPPSSINRHLTGSWTRLRMPGKKGAG